MGLRRWLTDLRHDRLQPGELDQRVARAEALAKRADRHIEISVQLRQQNHYAAIVEEALGLMNASRFKNGEAR